jgi:hypothetical protein
MSTLLALIDIPENIASHLPKNAITFLNFIWLLWFFISRAFKNLKAGGGWYGIKQALLWGDKTPDAKAADDAHVTEHFKQRTTETLPAFPPTDKPST